MTTGPRSLSDTPRSLVIVNAHVHGHADATIRIEDGIVVDIHPSVRPHPSDDVIDARGGALLPGLHDHHIHIHALAAARSSVACGPPAVSDRAELRAALREARPHNGWIRGIGYHEHVAGTLDRQTLDDLRDDVPIRIQHRSGIHWTLNTRALDELEPEVTEHPGAGRDHRGPTGVLTRLDHLLATAWPAPEMDLPATSALLASFGVTSITDATPDLSGPRLAELDLEVARGTFAQETHLLTADPTPAPTSCHVGAHKLILDDASLPSLDEFAGRVRVAHGTGRAVAVHVTTRGALAYVVAALQMTGVRDGDRIEHCSVCPPGLGEELARLGASVVTQPNLVAERGSEYLQDVEPDDLAWLYPLRLLQAKGIPTGLSTDAPYGSPDPWAAMSAAVNRTTHDGRHIGIDQSISAADALAGFLSSADNPGGPPRRLMVGSPAQLVLLRTGLDEALQALDANTVRASVLGRRWLAPTN